MPEESSASKISPPSSEEKVLVRSSRPVGNSATKAPLYTAAGSRAVTPAVALEAVTKDRAVA